MKVNIYTDGACSGNPGKGGYGAIIEYTDSKNKLHTKELSGGYTETTNNRMELLAVIKALEALTKPCEIDLYSDSKYVVDAFNQNWIASWQKNNWRTSGKKDVANVDLWKQLLAAKEQHTITFHWVKGHDGHPQNERCDTLATTAAAGNNLSNDTEFTSEAVPTQKTQVYPAKNSHITICINTETLMRLVENGQLSENEFETIS